MAHLRILALVAAAVASTHAFVAPATPLPRMAVRRAPTAPQMGLVEFLQNFFASDVDAGPAAKSMAVDRLKVVLAHDRAGIDEKTMLKIREEIFTVLSKYVVIEEEAVNFDVTCAAARRPAAAPLAPSHPTLPLLRRNEDRLTLLTASFPLLRRRVEEGGDAPTPAPAA